MGLNGSPLLVLGSSIWAMLKPRATSAGPETAHQRDIPLHTSLCWRGGTPALAWWDSWAGVVGQLRWCGGAPELVR